MDPQGPAKTSVEERLSRLESKSSGGVAMVVRLGAVVGCIGGILSLPGSAIDLWKTLTARPAITANVCPGPTLRFDPSANELHVQCAINLENTGQAQGEVANVGVDLGKSDIGRSDTEPLLPSVFSKTVLENKLVIEFPKPVAASARRELLLLLIFRLQATDLDRLFDNQHVKLRVTVDVPDHIEHPVCFFLNESTLSQLKDGLEATYDFPDPECT